MILPAPRTGMQYLEPKLLTTIHAGIVYITIPVEARFWAMSAATAT